MPIVIIGNNTGDDYSGTEDTYIKEKNPLFNAGSASFIEVTKYGTGDYTHSLLKFSGLSNIPSAITVSASSINLYYYYREGSGSRTVTAKRLLRNWLEGTQWDANRNNDTPYSSCWNEYGGENSWSTAGGVSDGNDRASAASGTLTMDATGSYKALTGAQLNTDIANMCGGTYNNYGWHLERTDGTSGAADCFRSSEGTDGQRPYLSVTYTESGGALPAIINNYRQQGVM